MSPGCGCCRGLKTPRRAPARVDAQLCQACLPAQVAVVDALDSALADAIARAVVAASIRLLLQLLRRDLADMTKDVRAERQVRIVPERGRVDVDAPVLVLVLEDVRGLRAVHAAFDRDRRQRIGRVPPQQPDDRPRRHVEDAGEAAELSQLARPRLRQVLRPDTDDGAGHVRHEWTAALVDDRPSRRLDPNRADLVVLGLGQVVRPGQHLQRPEPKQEHREDGEREQPEDADAQGELGREAVRDLDVLVRREELRSPQPPQRRPCSGGATQSGAPPEPAGRCCRARGSSGKRRRPGARSGG